MVHFTRTPLKEDAPGTRASQFVQKHVDSRVS
jgi:hypothetical protein